MPASRYDIAFLQGMIQHHKSALTMSEEYLTKPASQRLAVVTDLARGIITAQKAEIKQMTDWLKAAGAPLTGGMGKGDMGGMNM